MIFPKLSQVSLLALALVSPAFSCVSYSCNINFDNGLFNAALTDNGVQVCSITNQYVGIVTEDNSLVTLHCNGDAHATFNFNGGEVTYYYASFYGSFGTVEQLFDNSQGMWYTANVWGC